MSSYPPALLRRSQASGHRPDQVHILLPPSTLPLHLGCLLDDLLHPRQRIRRLLGLQRLRIPHRVHQHPDLHWAVPLLEDLQAYQGMESRRDGLCQGYPYHRGDGGTIRSPENVLGEGRRYPLLNGHSFHLRVHSLFVLVYSLCFLSCRTPLFPHLIYTELPLCCPITPDAHQPLRPVLKTTLPLYTLRMTIFSPHKTTYTYGRCLDFHDDACVRKGYVRHGQLGGRSSRCGSPFHSRPYMCRCFKST